MKLYVLEWPILEQPSTNALMVEWDAYNKHQNDALDASCLMLATMNSNLQKQHENIEVFDMIKHLKMFFQMQTMQERFEALRALFQCRLADGSSVGPHVL